MELKNNIFNDFEKTANDFEKCDLGFWKSCLICGFFKKIKQFFKISKLFNSFFKKNLFKNDFFITKIYKKIIFME